MPSTRISASRGRDGPGVQLRAQGDAPGGEEHAERPSQEGEGEGAEPFIESDDPECVFVAADYVRRLAAELGG